MQLFGTFVEVEGENINARLNQLIPVLLKALQQGVKTDQDDDDESSDESEAGSENEADVGDVKRRPLDDKCLFNSLSCIGKLFTKLPTVFQNEVYNSQINEFLSKSVTTFIESCNTSFLRVNEEPCAPFGNPFLMLF